MKKLFLNFLTVGLLLLSGFITIKSSNNDQPHFEEAGIEYGNRNGIKIQSVKAQNESNDLEYSETFAQYAKSDKGIYYLRFATAIRATSLDSIVYHRSAMEGKNGATTIATDTNVTTVYSYLVANGVNTYYDGTGLVNEPNENTSNYYWACYTLKFNDDTFHNSNLTVTLDINGVATDNIKETSLTKIINNSIISYLPNDPSYESGAPTTKYRMEAECADITYNNNTDDVSKNTFSDYNNIAFSNLFSNNLGTKNLNNCPDSHLTFRFNSSESYKVKLNLMISALSNNDDDFKLVKYISISNDGIFDNENVKYEVDLSDKSFKGSEGTQLAWGGDITEDKAKYWMFKEVEVDVGVFKGENTLTINMIGKGGANLDYIELDSSATFTGFDNNNYNDDNSTWYVSTKPTDKTTGVITVKKEFNGDYKQYSYGIPSLKDENGNLNSIYKVEDYGYSMRVKNETVKISAITTLTIDDKNIKFANGTNSLTKATGELLNNDDISLVDGRRVSVFNVYDAETRRDMGTARPGKYKFLNDNVILKPRAYLLDGFTQLDPTNERGTRKFEFRNEGTSKGDYDNIIAATDLGSVIVGKGDEGIYGEEGVQIGYNGTLKTGMIFRANTKVSDSARVVTKGKAHSWAYTFENKGRNPIHLRLNQVNSGANIEPGDEGVMIKLAPGESMQFVITISFTKGEDNMNALSMFTVLSDTVDMKLAMALSVKLAK